MTRSTVSRRACRWWQAIVLWCQGFMLSRGAASLSGHPCDAMQSPNHPNSLSPHSQSGPLTSSPTSLELASCEVSIAPLRIVC